MKICQIRRCSGMKIMLSTGVMMSAMRIRKL